jgi:hypothetical protein
MSDAAMLIGKNRLSHYLDLWPFQGNLKEFYGVFYATAFTPKQNRHF